MAGKIYTKVTTTCTYVARPWFFFHYLFQTRSFWDNWYMSVAYSALTLLVGWQEGHLACKKTEWWGAGMVICLERGADLHVAQLMPLPLTVSCFSKIQIGFTFLQPAHLGSPGKGPLNVCVCFCSLHMPFLEFCPQPTVSKHRSKLQAMTRTCGLVSSFLHPPSSKKRTLLPDGDLYILKTIRKKALSRTSQGQYIQQCNQFRQMRLKQCQH